MGNPYKKYVCKKCVGRITWAELRGPNMRMIKVYFGQLKPNLKQTELQKPKKKGKKGRIRRDNKKQKNKRISAWATLKRLKRGDDNELERNVRPEKVVSSKELKLAVETEEERRARLENDAASK